MSNDYRRIEKAIRYIRVNVGKQPSLDEIAAHVGLSPFHFQRLFRHWAGVSPKRFLEYLTVSYAKALLSAPNSILHTSYALGLSGAGRLHDHFVSIEAISPGEFKSGGQGLCITYGVQPSPFGQMLLAKTQRGICAMAFEMDDQFKNDIENLRQNWPNAEFVEDPREIEPLANTIFNQTDDPSQKIHLTVRGTNFQVNVWKALLNIPSGHIASYQQVAQQMGKAKAHRAVATAIANNPVGFLIPCHRVLRNTGDAGIYHWGKERKQAMIAWEAAQNEITNSGEETDDRKNNRKLQNTE